MQAVRLLIETGQAKAIRELFVRGSDESSYDLRIASGFHQLRLFINGEQRTVTVDDYVPAVTVDEQL